MISVSVMRLAIGLLLIVGMVSMSAASNAASPLVGSMKRIDGTDKDLSDYSGKVVVVVNVASQCGYTSQYAGLQKLYDTFKDKVLLFLDFQQTTSAQGPEVIVRSPRSAQKITALRLTCFQK